MDRMENKEKTIEYIKRAFGHFIDSCEEGSIDLSRPTACYFEICGTDCTGRFRLEHFRGDPEGECTFMISVCKNGTDREFTQFDFNGNLRDFEEYLKTGVDHEKYSQRIMNMVEKAYKYADD